MCAIRVETCSKSSKTLCDPVFLRVVSGQIVFTAEGTEKNRMAFTFINPESLGAPRGYSNGVLTEAGGRWLFIAGQVAWDAQQQIVSDDLVEQFDRALANVIAVVTEAGGTSDRIARLVLYVTDKHEYRDRMKEIG